MNFFSELKRHNVLKVALVYLMATANLHAQEPKDELSLTAEETNFNQEELDWLSKNKTIRVAAEIMSFPYEFIDDDGKISGISGDFLSEISKRLNIEFVWAGNETWNDGLLKIKSGEADMLSAVAPTKERTSFLKFTDEYMFYEYVIFTGDGERVFSTLESLNGYTIAQIRGTVIIDYIRRDYPDINIIEVDDNIQAITLVSNGGTQAFIGDIHTTAAIISELGVTNIEIAGIPAYRIASAMGIRTDLPLLASILQKTISDIDLETRNEIANKWLSIKFSNSTNYGLIWKIALGAIFIFGVVLIWNYILRREIQRRIIVEKKYQEELHRAQKMEVVGQLTGGIAHDFNNLLSVIAGNLEMLDLQLVDAAHRKLLAEAQKASGLGIELTDRLLAFAKQKALEPINISLNDLIVEIEPLLRGSVNDEITTKTKLADDLELTLTDPGQIENTLLNLTINARHAMPHGGTLTIETRNVVLDAGYAATQVDVTPGRYVALSVGDTGTGMSEEVLERAFEPFFSTKEPGKGSGLGLSMIYGFAKQSGGHVAIESELGLGTTITLYLPPSSDSKIAPKKASVKKLKFRKSGDEKVLVVEDDPRVRKLTIGRLESLGYNVVSAEDGPQAIEMIKIDNDIVLVLSDVAMPGGLTGFEVAELALTLNPELKIILSSGFADREKIAASTHTFLQKPYSLNDLAQALEDLLD